MLKLIFIFLFSLISVFEWSYQGNRLLEMNFLLCFVLLLLKCTFEMLLCCHFCRTEKHKYFLMSLIFLCYSLYFKENLYRVGFIQSNFYFIFASRSFTIFLPCSNISIFQLILKREYINLVRTFNISICFPLYHFCFL